MQKIADNHEPAALLAFIEMGLCPRTRALCGTSVKMDSELPDDSSIHLSASAKCFLKLFLKISLVGESTVDSEDSITIQPSCMVSIVSQTRRLR